MILRIGTKESGFRYMDEITKQWITDPDEIKRINKLGIPPAYVDVRINKNPSAKILAYGFDSKGRKQIRYHPSFVEKQARKKFKRVLKMDDYMVSIEEQLACDMSLPNDHENKALAVVIGLIIQCGFRVGNEKYAKENNSYGITTFQCRHLTPLPNGNVHIKFIGKKGILNESICEDSAINRFLKYQLSKKGANDVVFDVKSHDVNVYLKKLCPSVDITSKDIRTWAANKLFVHFLAMDETKKAKNPIKMAAELVAKQLHNTPTICLKSYIVPMKKEKGEKQINK